MGFIAAVREGVGVLVMDACGIDQVEGQPLIKNVCTPSCARSSLPSSSLFEVKISLTAIITTPVTKATPGRAKPDNPPPLPASSPGPADQTGKEQIIGNQSEESYCFPDLPSFISTTY